MEARCARWFDTRRPGGSDDHRTLRPELVTSFLPAGPAAAARHARVPVMREPRPRSQSLKALGLRKVTVLVPEASAEGLRQFARELSRRQETGATPVARQWRRFSPSAELMVDPERGLRCAIRDTGATGSGRYHWTVTVFGDTDPVAAGRAAELGEARSRAEAALTRAACGNDVGCTPPRLSGD